MAITLRQSAQGTSNAPTLPGAPLTGSLIVVMQGSIGTTTISAGFTQLTSAFRTTVGGGTGMQIWTKAAPGGDTGVYSLGGPIDWVVLEFENADDTPIGTTEIQNQSGNHPNLNFSVGGSGEVLVIGGFCHNNTLLANFAADSGYTIPQTNDIGGTFQIFGVVYQVDASADANYTPGVSTAPFSGGWCGCVAAFGPGGGGGGGGTSFSQAVIIG